MMLFYIQFSPHLLVRGAIFRNEGTQALGPSPCFHSFLRYLCRIGKKIFNIINIWCLVYKGRYLCDRKLAKENFPVGSRLNRLNGFITRSGGVVVTASDVRLESWWFKAGLIASLLCCFLRQETLIHILSGCLNGYR